MTDDREKRALELKNASLQRYGAKAASTGGEDAIIYHRNNVIDTGSLTWNYMLGTGGWPYGCQTEVFGPESIGKSTIAGAGALRGVQAQGGLTACIATEPDISEDWLEQHGVNLSHNVILYPDYGEQAFEMLHDLIFDDLVNFVLFDSLGGLSALKAIQSDKPQAYGDSALITWGVKQVAMRARKNNIGVMYVNQIRDDTKSKVGGYESPGGHALKHQMKIRTQLKPGKDRYTVKDDTGAGSIDLLIGRQIKAVMKKNKAAQGMGKTATFDYYYMEAEGYPFGFDVGKDILTAATLSKVITGSGWLHHKVFPNGKINGKPKAMDFLLEHPDELNTVRNEVLDVMYEQEAKKAAAKRRAKSEARKLKVVE